MEGNLWVADWRQCDASEMVAELTEVPTMTETVTGTYDEESKRQEDRCNKTDEADGTMMKVPAHFNIG